MKKLSVFLALAAVGLMVYVMWFTGLFTSLASVDFILLRARRSSGMLLAIFLMLLAVFLRIVSSKSGGVQVLPSRMSTGKAGAVFVIAISAVLAIMAAVQMGSDDRVIRSFNRIYYGVFNHYQNTFLGVSSMQYPADNWVIQEILCETKPDLIVETGTAYGGTALFYASLMETLGVEGRIITVDIEPLTDHASQFPVFQKRVEVIRGDSVSDEVLDRVRAASRGKRVFVTLDSLHTKEHVLKELELYAPLVSAGQYLVVQDTNIGRRMELGGRGGPGEAVDEFLKTHPEFVRDRKREKHLATQHPGGFLKRVSPGSV